MVESKKVLKNLKNSGLKLKVAEEKFAEKSLNQRLKAKTFFNKTYFSVVESKMLFKIFNPAVERKN